MRLLLALATLAILYGSSIAEEPTLIGSKVADFSLTDFRGQSWSLADTKERKIVVLVFLGVDCPMARSYGPKLARMARDYESKGVVFVGLDPNSQDSATQIADFARKHEIAFPILKDLSNQVADRLLVKRTPEVRVLDGDRIVRYAGRIDDQFTVGVMRDKPRQEDLVAAIDQLLAGKPVGVSRTEATGCLIGRVKEPQTDSRVTYCNQISRLLNQHCVECHRSGEIAPFALTNYKQAAGWADMIQEVIDDGRMPPWHADPKHGRFLNERRLSLDEKRLVREWVAAGAPEGDPKELPEPRAFTQGWQLPKQPDKVIAMSKKPYAVPAEGVVKYQYFVVDSGFTEDKWFNVAEVIPSDRTVVHHVLVFAKGPKDHNLPGEGGLNGFLAAYVPGLRPIPYPDGMAKRIPAGSQIIFQVHYTPNGSKHEDISKLGLVFVDPASVRYEVRTSSAVQRRLNIPAGEADYRTDATSFAIPDGTLLLGLMPHMHLRGKSFSYEAVFSDQKREMLMDVPHYDFNWQTTYRLSEPRKLPAGTRIHTVAHFDNSPGNPHNPDPKKTVRWGDQTWDEMMIGYFDLAIPRDPKNPEAAGQVEATARARQLVQSFDKNGDGKIERDELPERMRPIFDRLDVGKKGSLTLDEVAEALKTWR